MPEKISIAVEKRKFEIHEDWAVVVLGFFIIIITLLGLVVPVPSFSWSNGSELINKVLAPANLLNIGAQFLLVFIFSILGALLTNKSIRSIGIVFPTVYILTVLALILAGNKGIRDLNLEAVILVSG